MGYLASTQFIYKGKEYTTRSNLLHYGYASYALMYGQDDSIGVVFTKDNHHSFITVALGATDAFHRDQLLIQSIDKARGISLEKKPVQPTQIQADQEYNISILGDTYFG